MLEAGAAAYFVSNSWIPFCWTYYIEIQVRILFGNKCNLKKFFCCICIVTRPRAPVIGYCIAQYDYEATSTNQISLREGDGIAVVSKVGEATGWWKGNNNGKVKSHTVNFV